MTSPVTCKVCGLENPTLRALGSNFHKNCFNCPFCNSTCAGNPFFENPETPGTPCCKVNKKKN